jgi:hypothetical protein
MAAPGGPLPPDFFDPMPFANHKGAILGICIPLMVRPLPCEKGFQIATD